jgi:hypothetical protein
MVIQHPHASDQYDRQIFTYIGFTEDSFKTHFNSHNELHTYTEINENIA